VNCLRTAITVLDCCLTHNPSVCSCGGVSVTLVILSKHSCYGILNAKSCLQCTSNAFHCLINNTSLCSLRCDPYVIALSLHFHSISMHFSDTRDVYLANTLTIRFQCTSTASTASLQTNCCSLSCETLVYCNESIFMYTLPLTHTFFHFLYHTIHYKNSLIVF